MDPFWDGGVVPTILGHFDLDIDFWPHFLVFRTWSMCYKQNRRTEVRDYGISDFFNERDRAHGGTLMYSSYARLGPVSAVYPKNIWNIRHTQKIFEILATPPPPQKKKKKNIHILYIYPKCIDITLKTSPVL